MELRRLKHFLAVIEHGSLGKAALALHLSQPALSKSLRLLEQELRVPLVERTSRGVVPTSFGVAVADRARVVRAEVDDLLHQLDGLLDARRGRVSVGAGPIFEATVLPTALETFLRDRPHVDVSVVAGLNEVLFAALCRGELDFALSAMPLDAPHPDLVHETLFHDDIAVAAGARHPLAKRRGLRMPDLLEQGWVTTGGHELVGQQLQRLFHNADLPNPRTVIQTEWVAFTKSMVQAAPYLCFPPRRMLARELANGSMVTLNIPGSVWHRRVGLSRRRRGRLSPVAQALMNVIRLESQKQK